MTFDIVEGSAVDALVPEWSDLTRHVGTRVAARPSYALNWHRNLGRGRLAVGTARRGGRLVAVAPLHRRNRLGVQTLRFPGHGLGTIGTFVATDGAALAELVDGIAATGMSLQLTHIDVADPLVEVLRTSPLWNVGVEVDDRCLTIDLPSGAGATTLRGSRTLKTLRRAERALEGAGTPARVEVIRDPEHLERRWDDIVAVAAAADEHTDRDNFFGPPFAAFTKPLLEAEARAGTLLVVGLVVGTRWCAHEIMFRTGDVAEMWMARFHPDVRRYQPGQLLQRWLADHHDALGIARFDYMVGVSEFKSHWANGEYRVGTVVATPVRRRRARWMLQLAERGSDWVRPVRRAARDVLRPAGESV